MANPVTDFLKRDLGPLPVWAWGLAGMAGIGVGLVFRRTLTAEAEPAARGNPGDLVTPVTAVVGGSVPGGAANTTPGNEITTNSQWRRRALSMAIAAGADAVTADQALSAYLNGRPLTVEQTAIIEEVLRRLGLPPDPPRVVDTTPTPPAPDPEPGPVPDQPPPSSGRTITILVRGDGRGGVETLEQIARRLGSTVAGIIAANPGVNGDADLRPGMRLVVPVGGTPGPAPAPSAPSPPPSNPAPPAPPATPTPAPSPPQIAPPPVPPTGGASSRPPLSSARRYTVRRGDSLSLIAGREYGNICAWPTIYDANRGVIGGNPNLIKPGQNLTIPSSITRTDPACTARFGSNRSR